ncbi:MAG: ABC transporter permease [Candidatus Ornithospirochaeta sp.]
MKISHKFLFKTCVIVAAILTALLVGAVMILATGENVFRTYSIIISMPFSNFRSFCEVLVRMIPLTIIALGICVSSRCGINNIGAEGQMAMGIIAATASAFVFAPLPRLLAIPLCILMGAIAGGAWGFIPGILKARLDVSELLSTVMLNYAAAQFYAFMIRVPLIDPNEKTGTPMSARLPESTVLNKIFSRTALHEGIYLALILAVVVYILLWKTSWGYKMRAAGASQRAAKYGGINVQRYLVVAMIISGACAGMAGAVELMGNQGRAMEGITGGYGFSGIVVALFGGLHPAGIIPAAFFFGILLYAQVNLQILTNVPPNLVEALQGLIILIIVAVQMIISNPYLEDKFRKKFFPKKEA